MFRISSLSQGKSPRRRGSARFASGPYPIRRTEALADTLRGPIIERSVRFNSPRHAVTSGRPASAGFAVFPLEGTVNLS